TAMPRKPKVEKRTVTVVVNGSPIAVVLHPPAGRRRSWYAFWTGLVSSKSTGHRDLDEAIVAAENMVRAWREGGTGKRATPADGVMTDKEFDEIQRVHFLVKRSDPAAQERAKKTHKVYVEAAAAFRALQGVGAHHPGHPRRL